MRWARGLLPLIALSFVLVACTGTTENLPPLLLAVSRIYGSSSQPQMVLVEDAYNSSSTSATVSSPPTVVSGSALPLPYPAVASDTVDRAGTRSAMVVLTRQLAVGSSPASALVTFNLTGIDPNAPSAFHQTSLLQLTGGTSPLFSSSTGPWCFSGISVSLTGRYVYLVDDPNACLASPPSGLPVVRLYQVDTANGKVTEVAPPSVAVLPTVPFDDQAPTPNESLYVLVQGVQGSFAQLWKVPVPYDSTQWTQPATLPGTDQLALEGSGATLLAATNGSPYGTPQPSVSSTVDSISLPPSGGGTSVATIDGVRAMAIDPTGASTQVVVAGYDQVAVLATPKDAQPEATPSYYDLTGVAATMDYNNNYAYIINDGDIVRLDLLSLGTSSSNWYSKFSLPSDLILPTDAGGRYLAALSWTRALAAAP